MNYYKVTGIILGVIFAIFFGLFGVLLLIAVARPEEIASEDLIDLLRNSVLGNFLVLLPGILSVIFAIVIVMLWFNYIKHKDLRYKMAFYLYHSKIKKDDTIPLQHLARVAVCSRKEIIQTLQRMIDSRNLKGIVDQRKNLYIHKGLTKRTMRILTALPPARIRQLDTVKRYALEGAAAHDRPDDNIEELEAFEIEELPSASEEINKRKTDKTVPCPECGKLNRPRDHFCTYCGEIID